MTMRSRSVVGLLPLLVLGGTVLLLGFGPHGARGRQASARRAEAAADPKGTSKDPDMAAAMYTPAAAFATNDPLDECGNPHFEQTFHRRSGSGGGRLVQTGHVAWCDQDWLLRELGLASSSDPPVGSSSAEQHCRSRNAPPWSTREYKVEGTRSSSVMDTRNRDCLRAAHICDDRLMDRPECCGGQARVKCTGRTSSGHEGLRLEEFETVTCTMSCVGVPNGGECRMRSRDEMSKCPGCSECQEGSKCTFDGGLFGRLSAEKGTCQPKK